MYFRYAEAPDHRYPHRFDPKRSLAEPTRYPRIPHAEVYRWCEEHCGPELAPDAPERRWIELDDMYMFRYADDAFEFRMRWC